MKQETSMFIDAIKPDFNSAKLKAFTERMDEFLEKREKYIEDPTNMKRGICPINTFPNIVFVSELIKSFDIKSNHKFFPSDFPILLTCTVETVTKDGANYEYYSKHIKKDCILGLFDNEESIQKAKMEAVYQMIMRGDYTAEIYFTCKTLRMNNLLMKPIIYESTYQYRRHRE